MTDPSTMMMASSAALVGLGITCVATLRAWAGWLELKRLEVEGRFRGHAPSGNGTKVELNELKERVRKLEAIASGIEM